MSGIAQIKAARINKEIVQTQNEINEYALYQNVNVTYHNIVSFQRQKKILVENLKVAEQIKSIVKNRFDEGVARKQELNEAEVNVISVKDKIEQIDINLDIQKQILALFLKTTLCRKSMKM